MSPGHACILEKNSIISPMFNGLDLRSCITIDQIKETQILYIATYCFNCEFAICYLVDGAKQYYKEPFPRDTLPLYLICPRTLPSNTKSYHFACVTRATLYWLCNLGFT